MAPHPVPLSDEMPKVIDIFEGQPRLEGLEGFDSFQVPDLENSVIVDTSLTSTSTRDGTQYEAVSPKRKRKKIIASKMTFKNINSML